MSEFKNNKNLNINKSNLIQKDDNKDNESIRNNNDIIDDNIDDDIDDEMLDYINSIDPEDLYSDYDYDYDDYDYYNRYDEADEI